MTETRNIPAAAPIIGDEERAAVDRVMRSGMIAGGPEVEAFEHEFSRHVDGRECVAVNSGTSRSVFHVCRNGKRCRADRRQTGVC